jgi:hypothetical protein
MIHKIYANIISCLIITAALLLSGCKVDNGLITTIQLRDKFNQQADTFVAGDNITISLSIKNDSTSSTTLSFPSGYQYDFVVKDTVGNEIWRWSTTPPQPFVTSTTSFRLGPSDIHTATLTWDQHIDDIPTYLSPGNYIVEGYFVGYGAVVQADMTVM